MLSKKQRNERLKFENRNKFIDWTKKNLKTRVPSNYIQILRNFGSVVEIYSLLEKSNILKKFTPVLFEGALNANKFLDIYNTGFLPYSKFLFNGDWSLQEDNDPKHTSKKAKRYKKTKKIKQISFPVNSPDLNLIENVWLFLKYKIVKFHLSNLNQLKSTIKKVWRNFPQKMSQNLAHTMTKRCILVIEAKEDCFNYWNSNKFINSKNI